MRLFCKLGLILAIFFQGSAARSEWILQSTTPQRGKGVAFVEKAIRNGSDSSSRHLFLVLADPKQCTLRVIDNPGGKRTLGSAMEENGCLAGVNGSYFRPDFSPVGLEISHGRLIHPLEHGKLISGLVVANRGSVALLRIGEFKPAPSIKDAVQCGPFLIDHGKVVPGLNATKRADRTVVLADGKGGWGLLMAESVTLAEMAQILATPGMLPEIKVTRALNLDGGTSSAIWVNEPPVYEREFKRVRNFVAVVPGK